MSTNLLFLGAVGLSSIVLSVAQRGGFFQKHGVDVHLVRVTGTQIPELTERYPLGHIGAPATIMRAAAGADLRILASFDSGRLSNHLVVRREIEQPADLRGKRLGARVTGAALWIHTVLALDQLGLEPQRDDIRILQIGDPPAIMRALLAGEIDGAVVSKAQSRELTGKGCRVLFDLASANLHGAQDALVATAHFLLEHPRITENIVASLIEAAAFSVSAQGRAATLDAVRSELKVDGQAAAEEGVLQLSQVIVRKPYPSIDRLRDMQRIMSTVEPRVLEVDVTALVDGRFVRKLDEEGFIDAAYSERAG